jgi:hypothetical protein
MALYEPRHFQLFEDADEFIEDNTAMDPVDILILYEVACDECDAEDWDDFIQRRREK